MAPPADDPPSRAGAPPADDDMAAYLANVQLDALDLRGIELSPSRPAPPWAIWLCAAGFVTNAIGMALLPSTATYQLHSYGLPLLLVLLATEAGLGALLWRGLRLRQAAQNDAARPAQVDGQTAAVIGPDGLEMEWSEAGEGPGAEVDWKRAAHDAMRVLRPYLRALGAAADKHRKGLLFGAIVLLLLLVAFVLPHEAQWSGGTYSLLWFLTVGIAAGTGILVGRFIVAAGEAAPAQAAPLPPLQLPSWLRWANLALLVAGAITATVGPSVTQSAGPSDDFAFALVGLITGVCGAIWLARRFDEWEAGFKREAQTKQAQAEAVVLSDEP